MVALQQEHRSKKTPLGKGSSGTRRRLGQCDAGSWAAPVLAPIVGAAVACVLVLACVGSGIAYAKSLGVAPDPAPTPHVRIPQQRHRRPTPRPRRRPRARRAPRRSARSAPTGRAARRRQPSCPRGLNAIRSAATPASSGAANATRAGSGKATGGGTRRGLPRRQAPPGHQPTRAPSGSSARSDLGPLALMLRRLGELFRPANQAGSGAPQRNGLLLLLSAVALGVLVMGELKSPAVAGPDARRTERGTGRMRRWRHWRWARARWQWHSSWRRRRRATRIRSATACQPVKPAGTRARLR